MSLVYWLSKFSHEAMLIELFLIACITASYFGYLLIQKRRYGAAKKNIPDNVVRAYLVEMISQAEGFKNQLFGEDFKIPAGRPMTYAAPAETPASASSGVDAAELAAMRASLASAMARQDELQKNVGTLGKEKAALEARLAAAASTPSSSGGGDPKALNDANDKISKLESKLAEYEVIEDDLANLKKYQQENKQLRAQLDGVQKGGGIPAAAAVAVAPPPPPAAASAPEQATAAAAALDNTPIAVAEESAAAAKAADSFEGLVDKVEESLAAPAPSGASASDPVSAAQAKTSPPVADEAPLAEPAAAAPKEKSDADLLNEFERMLSS